MPPSRKDSVRLRHMLDSARRAIAFTSGKEREDLEEDEILSLALVRLLEVIGEASRGVSEEFRERHPEIKWRAIAGTRDRLAHGYYDVDMDVIWQIVTVDLPPLAGDLEKTLEKEEH